MRPSELYATAPMRTLLARELAVAEPVLATQFGNFCLRVRPAGATAADPPLHALRTCVDLSCAEPDRWRGDLDCMPHALPFVGESFRVVVVQHVLQMCLDAHACIGELARILAPEGVLIVSGFNRFSSWRPWLAWQLRGTHAQLRPASPRRVSRCLRGEALDVEQCAFPGALWPGSAAGGAGMMSRCGGSWLLVARKRRSTLTPLRTRAAAREIAVKAQWVPRAQRQRA